MIKLVNENQVLKCIADPDAFYFRCQKWTFFVAELVLTSLALYFFFKNGAGYIYTYHRSNFYEYRQTIIMSGIFYFLKHIIYSGCSIFMLERPFSAQCICSVQRLQKNSIWHTWLAATYFSVHTLENTVLKSLMDFSNQMNRLEQWHSYWIFHLNC